MDMNKRPDDMTRITTPETGRRRLSTNRLLPSGRRSATKRCCWRCPAAWIPRWWRRCSSKPSASSSSAYMSTTACCARASRSRSCRCSATPDGRQPRLCGRRRPPSWTSWPVWRSRERKRKIIGAEFIRVFEEEARKQEDIKFLAQGTIYPDILESDGVKAHHNVGGLPDDLQFELVEPAAPAVQGRSARRRHGAGPAGFDGLPSAVPRPRPGCALPRRHQRATASRAVRESDAILREEFAKNGLEGKVWQYFTIIPDLQVGRRQERQTLVRVAGHPARRQHPRRHDRHGRGRALRPACSTSPTASPKKSPASTASASTSPPNPRAPLSGNKTKRRKNPVFMRVCGVRRSLLITI